MFCVKSDVVMRVTVNLRIDQFIESMYSNCVIKRLVVVTLKFKSCNYRSVVFL